MKNLKHQTKLIILFIVTSIIPLILLNIFSINNATHNMQKIENMLLRNKLQGDIAASKMYMNEYLGHVSFKDGQMVDELGSCIEGNEEMVDAISADLGIQATLFAKKGNDFKRIATSIVDEDGNRVQGTMLDNAEIMKNINENKEYCGEVEILGEKYLGVYKPISGNSGDVFGILFVGIAKTESAAMISSNITSATTVSIMMLVIFIVIGSVLMLIAARMIVNPLNALMKNANIIATYNLKENIPEELTSRKDEIGALAKALQSIEENLKEMIKSVGKVSANVASTAGELANNCQEAGQVTEEMARTIQDVAQGATDQAESTAECMQRLDELGKLIESNKEHMEEMTDASNKVTDVAKVGRNILDSLSDKIKASNEATMQAYENMKQTNESALQISEASNVIASIADQTNLLALNASIEAARAGEFGRGFAVVADEIRKLAEQSAASTQQIDDQIKKLQKDAAEAVTVTEKVRDMLKEQTEDVKTTESKYNEIEEAIVITKQVVNKLNESSVQMDSEKVQVRGQVEALSAVAQENAASTEQSSACIEEQSASIHDMGSSSTLLAEMAESLDDMIKKFSIE